MTNNYLVATTSLLQDAPTDTAESEGGGDVGVRFDCVSVVFLLQVARLLVPENALKLALINAKG